MLSAMLNKSHPEIGFRKTLRPVLEVEHDIDGEDSVFVGDVYQG